MKKLFVLGMLTALVAGCASTANKTTVTTANQPLTLEEALQKSAETRQKLQEAKEAYQAARENSDAVKASSDASAAEQVKAQIKQKVADTKNQVDTEVKAWQEVLK